MLSTKKIDVFISFLSYTKYLNVKTFLIILLKINNIKNYYKFQYVRTHVFYYSYK